MFMCKPKLALTGLATFLSLIYSPISADTVTLNSVDGSVSISGDLLEYDGVSYRLKMLIGEITIEASQVECEGPGCPNLVSDITEFSIVGSNSIGMDLLPTLIEVYALERGGDLNISTGENGATVYEVHDADGTEYASISVVSNDSMAGFSSLMEGSAVIGMSSRRVSGNEVAAFKLTGHGLLNSAELERIVALDAVVVAVNDNNPVSILSLDQMASIFDGSITNWNQVGGSDAPIRLYRRDEASGTTTVFSNAAMAPSGRRLTQNAVLLNSDAEVSDAVAADENGIGLTSYAQEGNARSVAIRSVCGQLFEPSEFTIKSEEYPLTRRMYLYTNGEIIPDVASEFLAFVASDDAQSVILNSGFVGQDSSRATLDQQGRRMAQAIVSSSGRTELLQLQDLTGIVLDAERLSFTLRQGVTGAFDSRAMADIERLAEMIRDGEFGGRQLLVFGFSDNSAPADVQLTDTQDLAQRAREAIVAATGSANLGNVRISPIGYGGLLPLACNETPFGQARNNRVEIWVK